MEALQLVRSLPTLLGVPDYRCSVRTATSPLATPSKLPHDDYVGCAGVSG
jgi:hypothetical protein